MKLNLKHYLKFLSIITILISCSPEDGDIGPEGEQGIAGNANVQQLTIDIDPIRDAGSNFIGIEIPETMDVNKGSFNVYFDYRIYQLQLPAFVNFKENIFCSVEIITGGKEKTIRLIFKNIVTNEAYILEPSDIANSKIKVVYIESS